MSRVEWLIVVLAVAAIAAGYTILVVASWPK